MNAEIFRVQNNQNTVKIQNVEFNKKKNYTFKNETVLHALMADVNNHI